MEKSSSIRRDFCGLLLLSMGTMMVLFYSCYRDEVGTDLEIVEANVGEGVAEMRPLTPEEQEVNLMNDLIGEDKTLAALRHARNLMDSTNVNTRISVIETLAWIGKRALPEITEMMSDDSSVVATEAFSAWEYAFAEIDGEHRQGEAIAETVVKIKNQDLVNSILMHFTGLEDDIALPILSRIIEANTNFVGECAREMYSHIAGGELYDSPAATKLFLERQRADNNNHENGGEFHE